MAFFVLEKRQSGAFVLADSPAGPVITSSTPSPFDPSDTLTIVIGAEVPAGSVKLRYGSYEVAQTHSSWVEGSGITTIVTPITPGGLPFSANLVLRVTPNLMADIDASIVIEPSAGSASIVIASPITTVGSVLHGYTGSAPLAGWQMEHNNSPNTTLNPNGTFTQVLQQDFAVRVWDDSDNTRGSWGSAFLAAGIVSVNAGDPLVAGESFPIVLSGVNGNDVSFLTLQQDAGTKWTLSIDTVVSPTVIECTAPDDLPTGASFSILAYESKNKKDLRLLRVDYVDLLARIVALETP